MENIQDIYQKKDSFLLSTLRDNFWNYVESSIKNDKKSKNLLPSSVKKEIELVILNPDFHIFSIMFNNPKREISSYIEVRRPESEKGKIIKIRRRIDIQNFTSVIVSKTKIMNLVKSMIWEKKVTNESDIKLYEGYLFKKSTEEDIKYINDKENALQFVLVNSIKLTNSYFKAEIRLRTSLKAKNFTDNSLLLSYYKPINIHRMLDMEIELLNNIPNFNETDFKSKFVNLMRHVYAIKYDDFLLTSRSFYPNLKTNFIDILNLYKIANPLNFYITPKVDGEFKQFFVEDGKAYMISYGIMFTFETNIPKNYVILGSGELFYSDKKRILYPFHINSIKKDDKYESFTTRKEPLDYLKKIINDKLVNEQDGSFYKLFFEYKEIFGPFNDNETFYTALFKLQNKSFKYQTDGLILVDNYEIDREKIIDFKFKQNNTVDLMTSHDKNKDDKTFCFKFSYMAELNKQRQVNELFSIDISKTGNFFYSPELSMFVYQEDEKNWVLPPVFISEYSIEDSTFSPRLDKTAKFLKNRKYFGNNFRVVVKSILFHEHKLFFNEDILNNYFLNSDKTVANNFFKKLEEEMLKQEQEKMKMIEIKEKPNSEESLVLQDDSYNDLESFIIIPLNFKKNWYKAETNKNSRTALNVFTNVNKTEGLSHAIGPFIHKDSKGKGNYSFQKLLCVYSGKGGDLGKYINNNIKKVDAFDPDPYALEEMKKRHATSMEKTKIFDLRTARLSLEKKNFMELFNKNFGMNQTYDVIDIQLGIHFSLTKQTEDHIMRIFTKLSNKKNSNKVKTRILISTNDKDNITSLFKKHNKKESEILSLKIDEDNSFNISYLNDDLIEIFYQSSMNEGMKEYLMSKNYLIGLFKRYNFNLIQTWSFNETILDQNIIEQMSKKFNELSRFHNRSSTKNFIETISKENSNYDILDIMSIFRYYIFELE